MSRGLLLVGLGTRGKMWARVIDGLPGAHIAGAVDPSEQARVAFSVDHPDAQTFVALADALHVDYSATILVTPPDGHLDQCRMLFQARLPVLAEKPLAVTIAEAVTILTLAEAAGVPLSVGLNFRYLPVHIKQRELLTTAFLGTVGFAQFSYRRNRDGRRTGINKYPLTMRQPMMLEQTIHHFDLIRYCYGREVESILCRTWNPPWSMYADDANVHALLTLEGGVEINYFGTWAGGWSQPGFEWRTDCAQGVLVQRELFSDLAYARTSDPALTSIPLAPAEAFYDDTAALLTQFLDALESGRPVPCPARDHLLTLALCFAGIESAETGRAVRMLEFYQRNALAPWLIESGQ